MASYTLLQRHTGWSDTILQAIGSEAEAHIYMKAGLVEKTAYWMARFNDFKKCY